MAWIDNRPRAASAVTVEPTEVVAISRAEFQRRLDSVEPTMKSVIKVLCKRFRSMASEASSPKIEVNWADWRRKPKKCKSR